MVLLMPLVPITSFAGTNSITAIEEGCIVTPYWTGVVTIYIDLICSGGKANPVIDVEVDSSKVDKVNFNVSLLQYKKGFNINKQVNLIAEAYRKAGPGLTVSFSFAQQENAHGPALNFFHLWVKVING